MKRKDWCNPSIEEGLVMPPPRNKKDKRKSKSYNRKELPKT